MQEIQKLYEQFLNFFPVGIQPFVSIAMALFLIYSVIQVIKKDFIWLIALVILLPASLSIIKNIGQVILDVVKFLLPG